MAGIGNVAGLRIAHLIESDGPGGAERIVAELARTLQASGAWNVAVLPDHAEGWLTRELEGSGVGIEYFRLERPLSPAFARWLEAVFRRHRITLAHSHEFSMAVYGAWASWRAGVPHIITMHGGRYYAGALRRRLALRAGIELSGYTVAVSTRLARQMSRDLLIRPSRIATIPNGVRYVRPERTMLRDELGLGPTDRLCVAVGNLYPVKGHRHLVEALAFLAPRHPTLHVAISGRGDQAEPLAALARAHGIANRVHLLGLRSDVPAILAAADVFVLPSLSEGLPLALLEAMFAARPIVASDVGEVSVALAGGEAGALVPPGAPAPLAAAIDRLLAAPKEASLLGEQAARRARAEYDVSVMVRRYLSLYERVMGRRRSPSVSQPASRLEPAPAES